MTREEKINLLNKLLEIEEKLDIGNLTRVEKGEFRQWVETLEQEQEPMVEIDLYSVIKQKYIERVVLDKLRGEIADYGSIWVTYAITGRKDSDIERLIKSVLKQAKEQVLEIIDKYRAEQEET